MFFLVFWHAFFSCPVTGLSTFSIPCFFYPMTSSSGEANLEDLYADLSLDTEEENPLFELNEQDDAVKNDDFRWSLMGRFLTDESFNVEAMKTTLSSVWRSVKGICIKEISSNLFIFQFFHERDID